VIKIAEEISKYGGWIVGFLSLGIFAAICSVILSSVQSSLVVKCTGNATMNITGTCVDPVNNSIAVGTTSAQYNVTNAALTGNLNLTNQFGTAGTLVGLAILALAAILIVSYFYKKE
jgi:hypothetical protein